MAKKDDKNKRGGRPIGDRGVPKNAITGTCKKCRRKIQYDPYQNKWVVRDGGRTCGFGGHKP